MPATYSRDDVRRTYKARDAWWTVLLVDPVATPVVRLLANRTRVTPNQLTVVAFLLGLGAAAAFWFGQWRWLVLGGVLFYLAFWVDCMDGKVARLKHTGSAFGQWLDFVADRVRFFVCLLTLVVGQYLLTGQALYLLLGMCAVFVDALRYISSAHSERLRQDMRARISAAARKGGRTDEAGEPLPFIEDVLTANPDLDPEAVAAEGNVVDLQQGFRSRFTFYNHFRGGLRRRRIRPHLWSGIEFEMFVLVVGPLTDQVAWVTIGAGALLLVFEVVLVYKLWLMTRDFERTLAAYSGATGTGGAEAGTTRAR